jgi:hypothetical protein
VATMVVVAVRRYARPSRPNTSTFRAGPGTRRPAAAGGPSSCPSRLGAAHAGRQRVIGGHILDSSALVAFAGGTSIYAAAAVWTAVEESIVLIVPSTAVAAAWTKLDGEHYAGYEVLLHLPVTVVDNRDESRARTIGQLGGPQGPRTRHRLRPRTRLAPTHRRPGSVRRLPTHRGRPRAPDLAAAAGFVSPVPHALLCHHDTTPRSGSGSMCPSQRRTTPRRRTGRTDLPALLLLVGGSGGI